MTIPVDSVYYDNGRPYVFTFDNGSVHRVDIETGISDSENMEVVSGLTASDQVIITWSPELYEGAPAVLEASAN
jgi:multidrug efflux pump subunit AcrA (membrane-fusion protein)